MERRIVSSAGASGDTCRKGSGKGTRIAPSDRRVVVRGFWRNQACGPGHKDHKRIWISSHERGGHVGFTQKGFPKGVGVRYTVGLG